MCTTGQINQCVHFSLPTCVFFSICSCLSLVGGALVGAKIWTVIYAHSCWGYKEEIVATIEICSICSSRTFPNPVALCLLPKRSEQPDSRPEKWQSSFGRKDSSAPIIFTHYLSRVCLGWVPWIANDRSQKRCRNVLSHEESKDTQ